MLVLRRWTAVVAAVLLAGSWALVGAEGNAGAQAPPESSGEVEVTYLDVPDDSGLVPRMMVNRRGEVVVTGFTGGGGTGVTGLWRNPVSHLWRDGESMPFEPYTNVNDISERGHVVGAVWEPDVGPEGARRPFVWLDGEQSMLPLGGGFSGEAIAVNDHGTAAGAISDPDNDGYETAVWRDGEILTAPVELAPDEASFAVDINNRDQVLMVVGPRDGLSALYYDRLMLWEVDGEVVEIGEGLDHSADSWDSYLTGDRMNEMGMVLLNVTSEGGLVRSYLWQDGELTDLGSLGADVARATALNDWGQVVGTSGEANGYPVPFLWFQGEMTEIDLPGGPSEFWVADINNWGQVVMGNEGVFDGKTEDRLLLWQNGRTLDLGEIDEFYAHSGAALSYDINDRGQVVGVVSPWNDSTPRFVMWGVSPLWGYPDGL